MSEDDDMNIAMAAYFDIFNTKCGDGSNLAL